MRVKHIRANIKLFYHVAISNKRNMYTKIHSHDISKTTRSTVINEMISMHIEECQASELRRQIITAYLPYLFYLFSLNSHAFIICLPYLWVKELCLDFDLVLPSLTVYDN